MAGPLYAGQYGPEGFESANGRAAKNTEVTVLTSDGQMATLYASKEKIELADNPTYTDEWGNLRFFAVPGEYAVFVNGVIFPIMVPIHPLDPAIGAWEGQEVNPIVDWFQDDGGPYDNGRVVYGAGPGDMYRDKLTGDLYQLR